MKCSGKMCLIIIVKVTKNKGFTLSVEDTLFEKPQATPPAVLGLIQLIWWRNPWQCIQTFSYSFLYLHMYVFKKRWSDFCIFRENSWFYISSIAFFPNRYSLTRFTVEKPMKLCLRKRILLIHLIFFGVLQKFYRT